MRLLRITCLSLVLCLAVAGNGHLQVRAARRFFLLPGPPAIMMMRLRGGGCATGGCGTGGCGSGGGGCGTAPPAESVTDEASGADWAIEDGPGDLVDASSSSAPSPPRRDTQMIEKEQQALVLAQRREQRDVVKEDVKRRAEGSIVNFNINELVDFFVSSWLQIQLRSCWRPMFKALQSDIIEDEPDELGPLTPADFRRIVLSGLEIFDEQLVELRIIDLTQDPGYVPPSEEEVKRRIARYMTLDTNGDGFVDLQEFSVRFLSLARARMLDGIEDSFRQDYDHDHRKVEEEVATRLIAFDETLQEDARPLMKLIDKMMYPLRTPGERAAALIERSVFGELSAYDVVEVARPWQDLEDVGEDGHVNVRTQEEVSLAPRSEAMPRFLVPLTLSFARAFPFHILLIFLASLFLSLVI